MRTVRTWMFLGRFLSSQKIRTVIPIVCVLARGGGVPLMDIDSNSTMA